MLDIILFGKYNNIDKRRLLVLLALTAIKCRLSYWRSPPLSADLKQSRKGEASLLPFLFNYKEFIMITEPNTRTDFFYVDNDYIEYLKRIETENRGYTCVPNVHYWNTQKFVFGAVLMINEISYFVPVSSYSRAQQDLILLRDKKDNKVLGSIRFNYMIPVPARCLHRLNIADLPTVQNRAHASKELAFCRRNRDKIYKAAKNTYLRVISGKYPELTKHSCDFKLLEKACSNYK